MKDAAPDVNKSIGRRVRDLRAERRLSLDALAERSCVSRSMISVIERGESSPTAALLEKLARALGVPLASLFDPPHAATAKPAEPLIRRADQPVWRDPASGYTRRNVSPSEPPGRIHVVEIHFPPGERVAFETGPDERRFHQQIWLLDGVMDIHVKAARYRLQKGDCLAIHLDEVLMFHNPGSKPAHYAVITAPVPKGDHT